jgi:hypothetical protein
MTVTIIISVLLVVLALLIKSLVASAQRESLVSASGDRLTVFNGRALEQLLSPAEDEYLRENLPRQEFHRIRRRRAALAFGYLRLLHQYTGELISSSESASALHSRETHHLLMIAFKLRFKIIVAQIYLLAQWIFPSVNLSRRVNGARLCRGLDQFAYLESQQRHECENV